MGKIIALISSPRKAGNSATIVNKIADAAKAKGNDVEFFYFNEMNAKGCQSCYGCKKCGICVQKDDMSKALEAFNKADGVIISTPIYFGQPCAQYRMFEDRLFGFLKPDFSTDVPAGKKLAVITTCGGGVDGAKAVDETLKGRMAGMFKMEVIGDIVYSEAQNGPAKDNAEVLAQAESIGNKF